MTDPYIAVLYNTKQSIMNAIEYLNYHYNNRNAYITV